MRKNPKALLKPSFLRRAQIADFELPLTVRLNAATDGSGLNFAASDDVLQMAPDISTQQWPQPADLLPGVQWAPLPPATTTLTGGFAMQLHFNVDTSGYGALGTLETTQGQSVALQGTPVGISDFSPTCAAGPSLRIAANTTVGFGTAGSTYGFINILNQTAAGVLHAYATLTSERADSCALISNVYTRTAQDQSTATPIVITYQGTFHLSPAITPDGRLRLGRITVDDSATPQQASFSYLHSCTADSATTCNELAFPMRFKLLKLTAELIVGSAPV